MSFLTKQQLLSFGFDSLGEHVRVSSKTSIYNPEKITIGDYARIDDFCILSAGDGFIRIGRYVHIGCYSSLIGKGPIILEDFSGISGRVSIYSSSDDFSGSSLAHPTVPDQYRKVIHGHVILRKHAIVGAGAVILPNVEIGIGAVVGALSLVKENCQPFGIYVGSPARIVGTRRQDLLELEREFLGPTKEH